MPDCLKDVLTGEVVVGMPGDILRSSAIGSCVVLSMYCPSEKLGGQAHIMLPGGAPHPNDPQKNRYAADAIDELLRQFLALGVEAGRVEACLTGAANVLKRAGDMTAQHNLDSVLEVLREKRIRVREQSTGGLERRSARFDIDKASVFFTIGDGTEALLWSWLPE